MSWPSAARPRPLRTLGLVLTILLPLVALVAAGSAYVHLDQASLIDDSFGDGSFRVDFDRLQEIDDVGNRVDALTGGYFLAVMATGAVFIAWQHRHAQNARALGERGGLGPPWAIGGWFVPLGSLVLPALQLHQSSRLSDPSPPPGRSGRGRPIVLVWMVVWALSGIVLFIGVVSEPTPDDTPVLFELKQLADDQVSSDRIHAAGAALAVVAAAIATVMVRQLTDLQIRAIARAQAAAPSAPPPPPRPAPPTPSTWGPPTAPRPSPPSPGAAPPPPPAPRDENGFEAPT